MDNLDEAILCSFQTIKAMLEFSLGYPVPIVQFQTVATDDTGNSESIEIFFSQSVYDIQKIAVPYGGMLFSFCEFSVEKISDFVNIWHAFYNKNRFTVDVIINSGVQAAGDKRPEQSFFFLISSLEALQRGYGNRELTIPEDEFICIKKLMFDALPKNETGNIMRNRIGNMNKPSLRQALHDVLNATQQHFSHRGINKDILVSNFLNYRTLLAHQIGHSEINDNVIFKWHLTEALWGITVIYMLKLLGFSDKSLKDIVENRRNMLNALNWIGEVSSKPFGTRVKENGS